MAETSQIKFLGDIIHSSGSLNVIIDERCNKAIGLRTRLQSITSDISLGSFHFEICLIMRQAVYINSILVNCKSWHYLSKYQIAKLEASDASFLQICFNSCSKVVQDAFYIKMGIIKMRHIIAQRHISFLHNILKRDTQSILRRVYELQRIKAKKFDWAQTMANDLDFYGINMTNSEISQMSKGSFSKIVKKHIFRKSFSELCQTSKSQTKNIIKKCQAR